MSNKSRIDLVREEVDGVIEKQSDKQHAKCGYIHLYGVATICNQLAILRGLNPELAIIAGMLHDIYTYRTRISKFHAHNGAEDSKVILKDLNRFTEQEQELITSAIYHHSSKEVINEPFDELLKDADVLQHYLVNPHHPHSSIRIDRLRSIFRELGMDSEVLKNLDSN